MSSDSKTSREKFDKISRSYELINFIGRSPNARALRLANIKPDERILEIGFGTGSCLKMMVGYTKEVYGVETSLGMANVASQRLKGSSAIPLVGDGTLLPFSDKCFDLVFASGVLDLLTGEDALQVLNEASRVLKPQGRLVLVNLSKLKGDEFIRTGRRLYEWLYFRWPRFLGHYRPLSRPIDVQKILFTAGFKIILSKLVSPLFFPLPVEISIAAPKAKSSP